MMWHIELKVNGAWFRVRRSFQTFHDAWIRLPRHHGDRERVVLVCGAR